MTITPSDLGWGSYGGYSGWYYFGKKQLGFPTQPSDKQIELFICCKTEGNGTADPFNGYDSCGWSIAGYQLTELCSGYAASRLLGDLMENAPSSMVSILEHGRARGYDFKKGSSGLWRWHKGPHEVGTPGAPARALYGLHSDGKTWDAESKEWAAGWACQLVNIFQDHQIAVEVQRAHLIRRMYTFIPGDAAWLMKPQNNETPHLRAGRAAFMSFCLNRPSTAAKWLNIAAKDGYDLGSPDWLVNLLQRLTFGPNIGIYTKRLEDIIPLLEKHYGVDVPDHASEIKAWRRKNNAEELPTLDSVKGIQQALLALGYDLGPKGADGIEGQKTRAAVMAFQKSQHLYADGVVGKATRPALLAALKAAGKLSAVTG